jgi:uncharacterized protein
MVADYPMAYTQFLQALDFAIGPTIDVVIAGDLADRGSQEMLTAVHRSFLPNRSLLFKPTGPEGARLAALCAHTRHLQPVDHKTTAFICENFACQSPITDVERLREVLQGFVAPP